MTTDTQQLSFNTATDADKKRQAVFSAVRAAGIRGATLFELVAALNWPVNRISGRVSELKRMGLIVDSGLRRTNPASNKSGVVLIVSYLKGAA